MSHTIEVKLQITLDPAELLPGETPRDAAERIVSHGCRLGANSGDRLIESHELTE